MYKVFLFVKFEGDRNNDRYKKIMKVQERRREIQIYARNILVFCTEQESLIIKTRKRKYFQQFIKEYLLVFQ